MIDLSERNRLIEAAYKETGNYAEVGRRFGLTRDRIRQIILKLERLRKGREARVARC
jgi:DNA-directed RNA polymerase sigma subunit (sigma70/sigma32)